MKVLIICTVDFQMTGIPMVIINNYRYHDHSKIREDFVVTTPANEKLINELISTGAECHVIPKRKKRPFYYIYRLHKIIKRGNYDIIHIHGNSALMEIELLATMFTNKPIKMVHAHNTSCTYKKLHEILYPIFIKSYDYSLACSDTAGKWLYKNKEYRVFRNGINVKKFIFSEDIRLTLRSVYGIDKYMVILHVGCFNKQKNHMYLVEILKKIKEKIPLVKLLLVGEGYTKTEITRYVEQMGLADDVIFLGNSDKVNEYMMAADVFVLPSLFESLGIVNIEAQCSGLPCVVSDQVPVEACVSDYMHFLPLNNDFAMWAGKIIITAGRIRSPKDSKKVVDAMYNIEDSAVELEQFYKECLEDKYEWLKVDTNV